MKKMKLLDPDAIDLTTLAEALEDHSDEGHWWLDPRTGALESWSRLFADDPDDSPGERGFRRIEPLDSSESYADMEDFTGRVTDGRARELLTQAIAGRGAFRRFKDALHAFPELRKEWFAFHDARMVRRAIDWLLAERLIDEAAAGRAIAMHPEHVRTNEIEPQSGKALQSLFAQRTAADYGAPGATPEDATLAIESAAGFVAAVEARLTKRERGR